MAQHTPGPWQPFDTEGKPVNDPSVTSEKHVIATVWINDLPRKQAVANATLMAAAPDMLAALKGLVENPAFELGTPIVSGRSGGSKRGAAVNAWDGFVEAARTAIAKAEAR